MHPAQQHHLEVVPRMRGHADVLLGPGQQIEGAHDVLAREALGRLRQTLALPFGQLAVAGTRRVDRDEHHVAHHPGQFAADELQVVARFNSPVRQRESARAVLLDHRVDQIEQQVATDEPEHRRHVVDGDGRPGKRNHLVEGALCVAHAPLGGARDECQRGAGHLDPLGLRYRLELLRDRPGRNGAELEDL